MFIISVFRPVIVYLCIATNKKSKTKGQKLVPCSILIAGQVETLQLKVRNLCPV